MEFLDNSRDGFVVYNFEFANSFAKKRLVDKPGRSCSFDFGKGENIKTFHSSRLQDHHWYVNPKGISSEIQKGCPVYLGNTSLIYNRKLIKEQFNAGIPYLPDRENCTMEIGVSIRDGDYIGAVKTEGMSLYTNP